MQDIIELERRIAAAFDRIDRGLEIGDRARATVLAPIAAQPESHSESAQMGALIRSLETARASNADWATRYGALEARMGDETVEMAGQIAQLTDDLAAKSQALEDAMLVASANGDTPNQQSSELQVLQDQMAALRARLDAQSTELDALRAQRGAEAGELDAIITALTPLIEEAEHNA